MLQLYWELKNFHWWHWDIELSLIYYYVLLTTSYHLSTPKSSRNIPKNNFSPVLTFQKIIIFFFKSFFYFSFGQLLSSHKVEPTACIEQTTDICVNYIHFFSCMYLCMSSFFMAGIPTKPTSRVRQVFKHWRNGIMRSRNFSSRVSVSRMVSTEKASKERQNKPNLGVSLGLEK